MPIIAVRHLRHLGVHVMHHRWEDLTMFRININSGNQQSLQWIYSQINTIHTLYGIIIHRPCQFNVLIRPLDDPSSLF